MQPPILSSRHKQLHSAIFFAPPACTFSSSFFLFFFSFFPPKMVQPPAPGPREWGGGDWRGTPSCTASLPALRSNAARFLNAAVSRAAVQTHYSLSNPLHPRLFTPPTPRPFPRCGSATAVDQKRPGCGRADQKKPEKTKHAIYAIYLLVGTIFSQLKHTH